MKDKEKQIKEMVKDRYIAWIYTNKLNDVMEQIQEEYQFVVLEKDIISITYDTNHGCYVVFFWATKGA